jgi:hypothetical protein
MRAIRHSFARACLVLGLAHATPATPADGIGDIEFFGYKGINVAKVRAALPVHQGDEYSTQAEKLIRQAVAGAIGKEPTDVAAMCCDSEGKRLLFVGLPGASYKTFAYNDAPKGSARLSADVMNLYSRLDNAIMLAVRKGGDAAREDDSNGYALIYDPDARALQLALRKWALGHERPLLRVLESSSDVEHRRVASEALGYARQSSSQIQALARAARDSDDEVRTNATRALGVLVRSNRALASQIPPETFIAMLNSGLWSDRNKGASLLMELTAARDPALLAKIRSEALDSLVEMALWHEAGHAYSSRMILGRAAGVPEAKLQALAWNGPVDEIVKAARAEPRY